ncbi:MAG TPA: HlyD family efflux transporter periplasmic adaptor subunit, partial [Rhodothermales bacterium]|nr:HlyD family efflux transporter periplasmic adaptor subunit [Rhodothermales bacterium]
CAAMAATGRLPAGQSVSGMIQNHNVQIGQSVMAYGQMMDIVPTQSIMVEAFVSPEQASSIRQGEEATLYMQGQPEVVRMTVTAIQAHMDETRHAVRVLLESQTLNGFPKPGQLVQVSFVGLNNGFATQVPLSAIEYEGDDAYVFVWKSSKQYERRAVKIIRLLEDMALISEGLNSGESVAVSEVFSLKALSRMAEFSE